MSKAEELAEALRTGDRSGIWYSGMEAAAELRRLQAENDALRKDAERYRWLRSQHWNENKIGVVIRPKDQSKLGSILPNLELLDDTIDHMKAKQ